MQRINAGAFAVIAAGRFLTGDGGIIPPMSILPTREIILQALQTVLDPELHRDIVVLNRVKNIELNGNQAVVTLKLEGAGAPQRAQVREEVEAALAQVEGLETVRVEFASSLSMLGGHGNPKKKDEPLPPQEQARKDNPLPQVKHIIAVGAGKGGVGKSTVSVNLAVALAREGFKVGLLDGDIYGPSIPTMLGLGDQKPGVEGQIILPFKVHQLSAMSVGCLVSSEQALVWRGPMAHGAFKQLATQTRWGVLDYLIIDLPPGTGDVPLTLASLLPLSGAVVVCTPQKVAQDDARRAIAMFRQLGVEVLGLVENMSYFIGDDGKEYDIFGKGGAEKLALETGVPFLGGVPINTALRKNSDSGDPHANFADGALSRDLLSVSRALQLQVRLAGE